MIEHRLECVARAARAAPDALEPALYGGQHGAEQLRHLGSGAEEEAFALSSEACDGTRLETRGVGVGVDRLRAQRERRRCELHERERALDVIAEPAHAHALRVRQPALAMARRRGLD